jgi:uncharacterized LabA/DUF88 family protein
MPDEPSIKRASVFIDGQNLFHTVKAAFGYTHPNFDPIKLSEMICKAQGWSLQKVHFYTGVPEIIDNATWNKFWNAKLLAMSRQGVITVRRPLKYRTREIDLPDGTKYRFKTGDEKGIDVRIALDTLVGAIQKTYDVALILSQDQDLSEVAQEIRLVARSQARWIKMASAYPCDPSFSPPKPVLVNSRGINSTDWIKITKLEYDLCIDPTNYSPKV